MNLQRENPSAFDLLAHDSTRLAGKGPNSEEFQIWMRRCKEFSEVRFGTGSTEYMRLVNIFQKVMGIRNEPADRIRDLLRGYIEDALMVISGGRLPLPLAGDPRFNHLANALKRFKEDIPSEQSVFVMMKFPEPGMEAHKAACLDAIYQNIESELLRHGLHARRADKKSYAESRQLWDNLCVYMLGCNLGIAVIEDHVGQELNPNVAFEFGFMKALGKNVVMLKERSFNHLRADFLSELPREFAIDANGLDTRSIRDGVAEWLTDIGIPPRQNR